MPLNAAELQVSLAGPGRRATCASASPAPCETPSVAAGWDPERRCPRPRILAQDLGLAVAWWSAPTTSNDSSAASPRAWDCGNITRSSSPA